MWTEENGSTCCSENNQCAEGEGDCDSDSDCKGFLRCGKSNCNPAKGFPEDADCCTGMPASNFTSFLLYIHQETVILGQMLTHDTK